MALPYSEVAGKTAKQILTTVELSWLEKVGQVALNSETFEYEFYSAALQKTYKLNCYSPQRGYFVTIFSEMT